MASPAAASSLPVMNLPLVWLALTAGAVFLISSCANQVKSARSPQQPIGKTKTGKRIVLFFDGTRNVPSSNTNVHLLYRKVAEVPVAADGKPQQAIYMQGVGTRTTDVVSGAAFGRGISRDVQEGYETLRAEYEPGDEIWIFGFSRGAFTARSLAGFVAQYGVLRRDARLSVKLLYKDYRTADTRKPLSFWTQAKVETPNGLKKEMVEQTQETDIEFIGVWDTVATVGLPIPAGRLSQGKNHFHIMYPRGIYKKCRQALAIDECRPHYRPLLWKRFVPDDQLVNGQPPPPTGMYTRYEQRWFAGAHSNVGGGYENNDLQKVSLRWMEGEAAESGLGIANREKPDPEAGRAPIIDSFARFWPYKIAFWTKRQPRPIFREGEEKVTKNLADPGKKGHVYTLNETVDESVYDRARHGNTDGSTYKAPE